MKHQNFTIYDNWGKPVSDTILGMPYTPVSESCNRLNVDVPDSMGYETHEAINRIKDLIGGDVVAFVADRLRYKTRIELCRALAAEQIDAVAVAIYNIEAYGEGIIISDQTGIGKGRQAAAIIRYGAMEGLKPVFFTEKPNLFSDLYRDLVAIGSADLVPFIVNGRESKTDIKDEDGNIVYQALPPTEQTDVFKQKRLPGKYDFIVCTYTQLSSAEKKPLKPQFIAELAKNGLLIFDEAHNASGSSNTGEFIQAIIKEAKGAVYLSATYAKRPDNMPVYALKTAIKEANLTRDQLIESIEKGGVALQEILSAALVKEGQMLRRERTYEGINVNYITLDELEQLHRDTADKITEIIRDIIGFQRNELAPVFEDMDKIAAAEYAEVEQRAGTQNAGVDNQPYFSKVFNVINQMLFSIKAEAVADRAIEWLKKGKKTVIAFGSTMESFLDDMGAVEGETIRADFALVLKRGLDGVLRYTKRDEKGNPEYAMLQIGELNPDAQKRYFDILNKIEKAATGISISPIDVIMQKIKAAGYRPIEVTGRKTELQVNTKTMMAVVMSRNKTNVNDAFRMFNNNEADVLLINQSGSTGASAHAIPTKKVPAEDVLPRVMLVLQAELDINREVQKRGRINRTGQIHLPEYDYASSAIPAEKRLMMMLARKLKSLDANTTSNQKQSSKILAVPDFLNKYGDKIVKEYLQENPEVNLLLGDPLELAKPEGEKKGEKAVPEDAAYRVSGRVAILSCAMQEAFYNEITERYNDYVEYLQTTGEYDLEVETMNLEAETLEETVVIDGKGGRSEFSTATVMKKVMANVLKKPYTKEEIETRIADELKGEEPKVYQRRIIDEFKNHISKRLTEELEELEKKYADLIEKIPTEKRIREIKDEAAQQVAMEERKQILEKAQADALLSAKRKSENISNSLMVFFSSFYPGLGCNYPVIQFDAGASMTKAVFIGVQIDRKRPNPFAPSAIKFKFALSDSNVFIALAGSGEQAKTLQSIIGASTLLSTYQSEQILKNWTDIIKASSISRKVRYIISGNILQAYGTYKSKLISYTTNDGKTEKGILMPDNWKPGEKQERTLVPIVKATQVFKELEPGFEITTNSGAVFERNYNNTFSLYVPGSKAKGGEVFLDADILNIVEGNNFNMVSGKMKAVFKLKDLETMIFYFQEKFSASVNVHQNIYEMLMEKNPVLRKPEPVKLGLKYEPVPETAATDTGNLLELEAEALALELELLSFSLNGISRRQQKFSDSTKKYPFSVMLSFRPADLEKRYAMEEELGKQLGSRAIVDGGGAAVDGSEMDIFIDVKAGYVNDVKLLAKKIAKQHGYKELRICIMDYTSGTAKHTYHKTLKL